MKKLAILLLASTLLPLADAPASPAQSQTLFDVLFPDAAKRKRARQARERQRAEAARRAALLRQRGLRKKIKAPTFKTYRPAPLSRIQFTTLVPALTSAATADAARRALQQEAHLRDHLFNKRLTLDQFAALPPMADPKVVRLSDGINHLDDLQIMARKDISKAVLAHYEVAPAFLWVSPDGRVNDNGKALLGVLEDADSHALNADHYRVTEPLVGASTRDIVAFEFQLTSRALRYALDARHGRTVPEKISGYHDFAQNKADASATMEALAAAQRPADFLLSLHPRDTMYATLQAELKRLEAEAMGIEPVEIAPGTFLKPGTTNPEVANVVEAARRLASSELLKTHATVFEADHSAGLYDEAVVAMVRDIQRQLKLKPDGIVGKRTIARLQPVGPAQKIERIRLAIERLRWHPDRLGSDYVFINQPAYRVQLIRNGQERIAMNVVVGKPSNQTSFFHDEIEYVEFNPYWGIPRSILVNEMLPKLRANPGYFDNLGYEVTDRRGRQISSWSVDWYSVGANFPFDVRQPPGPKNALGQLKIMFPNRHSIYMHDTPAKSLFARSTRAFSHGCVRLAEPKRMAAAVLQTSVADIDSAIAYGANKQRKLSRKLPVYVAYFTAWPDQSGTIRYFADIYGRDRALAKAMELESKARLDAENA